jgi:hypothetical protein
VTSQTKRLPLSAGARVIMDDFGLCCHNVYRIMASRAVLRAAATLLINSSKVRLYN